MSPNLITMPIINGSSDILHIIIEPQGEVINVEPDTSCMIYFDPDSEESSDPFEIKYCKKNFIAIFGSIGTALLLNEDKIS